MQTSISLSLYNEIKYTPASNEATFICSFVLPDRISLPVTSLITIFEIGSASEFIFKTEWVGFGYREINSALETDGKPVVNAEHRLVEEYDSVATGKVIVVKVPLIGETLEVYAVVEYDKAGTVGT